VAVEVQLALVDHMVHVVDSTVMPADNPTAPHGMVVRSVGGVAHMGHATWVPVPAGASHLLVRAAPALLLCSPVSLPMFGLLRAIEPLEASDAAFALMLAAPDLFRGAPESGKVMQAQITLEALAGSAAVLAAPFLLHGLPLRFPLVEASITVVGLRGDDWFWTALAMLPAAEVPLLLRPHIFHAIVAIEAAAQMRHRGHHMTGGVVRKLLVPVDIAARSLHSASTTVVALSGYQVNRRGTGVLLILEAVGCCVFDPIFACMALAIPVADGAATLVLMVLMMIMMLVMNASTEMRLRTANVLVGAAPVLLFGAPIDVLASTTMAVERLFFRAALTMVPATPVLVRLGPQVRRPVAVVELAPLLLMVTAPDLLLG